MVNLYLVLDENGRVRGCQTTKGVIDSPGYILVDEETYNSFGRLAPYEGLEYLFDADFPAWATGVAYAVNDIVEHGSKFYKCIQAHTSQAGWSPPVVPALWGIYVPEGMIVEWYQPAGAHDAFPLGAKVVYNGQVWKSVIADNVWAPGVYGWEVSTRLEFKPDPRPELQLDCEGSVETDTGRTVEQKVGVPITIDLDQLTQGEGEVELPPDGEVLVEYERPEGTIGLVKAKFIAGQAQCTLTLNVSGYCRISGSNKFKPDKTLTIAVYEE